MFPAIAPCNWFCSKCGTVTPSRSVWFRTRQVSYTREMLTSELLPDGRVLSEDAWWEPWGNQ